MRPSFIVMSLLSLSNLFIEVDSLIVLGVNFLLRITVRAETILQNLGVEITHCLIHQRILNQVISY
jgi:hypothetical protein